MRRHFFSATVILLAAACLSSCKYFKVGETSTRPLLADTTETLLQAWNMAYPQGWMEEEKSPSIKYLFYDIDKDGLDELFISRGPWSMAVFTFAGDSLNCLSSKWHDRMSYEVVEGGYLLEFFEVYESQFNREQNWIFYRLDGSRPVDSGWFTEVFSGNEAKDDFDSEVTLRLADSAAVAQRPFDLREPDYRVVEREEYVRHTPAEEVAAASVLVDKLPGWKEVTVEE
ncbi:MAG: hypothetical protein J6Y40_02085 [Bacteroidales bacterium]|nr:hypothetical protein [Bacteroidales bacterium]